MTFFKKHGDVWFCLLVQNPGKIYLFKFNTKILGKGVKKLTIKTPKRRQRSRPGVLIVKFEHISHCFLAFLLLILNK